MLLCVCLQALILKPTDAIVKKHLNDAEKKFMEATQGSFYGGSGETKSSGGEETSKKKKKKKKKGASSKVEKRMKAQKERAGSEWDVGTEAKQKQKSERMSEWDVGGGEATL